MKKIIIFADSISGIGGEQIFVLNKVLFFKSKNQNVYVFSSNSNPIFYNELKCYNSCILGDLFVSPYSISLRHRNKVINHILKLINYENEDEILIESHTIILSLWGDLVAYKTQGKNILFDLTEGYGCLDDDLIGYIAIKHSRKELISNYQTKFYTYLSNSYCDINSFLVFKPYCNRELSIVPLDEKYRGIRDDCDYLIGSIGRLEKPFVEYMIKDLISYILKSEYRIKVVFIGGSKFKKAIRNVLNEFKKNSIPCVITGFIDPINANFLKEFDLFISSAGSRRISAQLGIPTISYAVTDYKPNGFANDGYSMVQEGSHEELGNLIDIALFDKDRVWSPNNQSFDRKKVDEEFESQMNYFNSVNVIENELFSHSVRNFKKTVERFFIMIFGVSFYRKVIYFLTKNKKSNRRNKK